MSKSKRLRELIAKGAIMLPGVPNAAMGRQVERAGFDAVYVPHPIQDQTPQQIAARADSVAEEIVRRLTEK